MSSYLGSNARRLFQATPQTSPILGENQVQNNAGGYVYALDKWKQFQRWLVLGSEGGTYYAHEQHLTLENARVALQCMKEDGIRLVDHVGEISDSGRAPRNDPALFALALAARLGDVSTRTYALEMLPKVARIGTHLLHFVDFAQTIKPGWSRAQRTAIARWYQSRESEDLAYQLVKYRQRDGWSQRDLLRLAHPKPRTQSEAILFHTVTQGYEEGSLYSDRATGIVWAADQLAHTTNVLRAISLIQEYRLPREVVPTVLLKERAVWEALLPHMGVTAMIRNLATMTRLGVFEDSAMLTEVLGALSNTDRLLGARVHPIQILTALLTYKEGQSVRGNAEWTPLRAIVDELDHAFYAAFGAILPSHKRVCVALDVSGSMQWDDMLGIPGLTPLVGAAAMSLLTLATEPSTSVYAFSTTLMPVRISASMRLAQVVHRVSQLPAGGTDCALPMLHALRTNEEYDLFLVLTDNETWAGPIHPMQALRHYRDRTGIPARLAVMGMTSTGFSIADPTDEGTLDVVGFDAAAPQLIADFGAGRF